MLQTTSGLLCVAFGALCAGLLGLGADPAGGGQAAATESGGDSAGATGSDWYRFLGPTVDGKSPETGIRADWSGGRLKRLWEAPAGDGYSMPSVADGRLFHFARFGDRARLTCFDSVRGKELWRTEYPTDYKDYYGFSGGPRTSPVVDGNTVYVFGVEGMLRSHQVSDGELLWEVDTTKRFGVVQNFFGVGSTPIVEGDLLIAMVGGSPPESPSLWSGELEGNGSAIVAFDKRTGEVVYQVGEELASYSSPVTATIDGRRWGFVFARGGLVGFEPATGMIDFRFPWRSRKIESVNAANPVIDGNRVLVTESYEVGSALLAVRPGGYEVLRKDPPRRGQSMASHWSTPILYGGHLYGSSGEKSGTSDLRCVDFESGEVRWAERLGSRVTLLYVDGHFVVQTERGKLMLIRASPKRFDKVTEVDLGEVLGYPTWNAPILSHGILYVRGAETLLALELIPR